MAEGMNATVANAFLNALLRATNYTAPANVYLKLHTGAPGASGTSNAAGNTTRQQITCGSAASAGSIANTVVLSWTNVSTSETYSHFTVWDASTGGNFLFSGTLTANPVTSGDNFEIAIGALTVTYTVAS